MEVVLGDWDSLGPRAKTIRLEVFVNEQGVSPSIELDDQDPVCVHALAFDNEGAVMATGRLLPSGQIGRMAVLREHRGKGVGSLILKALVAEAQRRGDAKVGLSAQIHACQFYEAHGFVTEGQPYVDAGIDHIAMRLSF